MLRIHNRMMSRNNRLNSTSLGRFLGLQGLALTLLLGGSGGRLEAAESAPRKAPTNEQLMWTLGFQIHGITQAGGYGTTSGSSAEPATTSSEIDADVYNDTQGVSFGWGTGFTVPLTVNFFQGLGMRFALTAMFSGEPLFDSGLANIAFLTKVDDSTWTSPVNYRARDAWVTGGNLAFNVNYTFPLLMGTFKPYLGIGPGLFLNYVFTDLERDPVDYTLLDNQYNDPTDGNNIDPYSVNFQPGVDGYFGVNFMVQNHMHLNFEVAYDLANMPETALVKATDGSNARRAAYTYSVLKFSSGLLFNF